jgi:hypothetical protein
MEMPSKKLIVVIKKMPRNAFFAKNATFLAIYTTLQILMDRTAID